MRRFPAGLAAVLALIMAAIPAGAAGPEAQPRPRLVILAIDRLSQADLASQPVPNLRRLMTEGAGGLMTTRSPGGLSPEKIYLAIGAGEAMSGTLGAGLIFDRGESTGNGTTAVESYRLQNGDQTAAGSLLHLGLPSLIEANAASPGRYGRLGDGLRRAGLRLAVLGNADRNGLPGREAANILMDGRGLIALGHVGADTLLQDWRMVGGRRTDYRVLEQDLAELRGRADVILIILGDLARFYAASASLAPRQQTWQLRTTLNRIDRFVGAVMAGSAERILLLSATPPLARVEAGERLTPVALWGRGIRRGLLSSASTRQAGIVTQYDVAATIAAACDLDYRPLSMGHPAVSRPGDIAKLPGHYAFLVRNYSQRGGVLFTYGYFVLGSALLAAVLALWGRGKTRLAEIGRRSSLGFALTPVILLLIAPLPLGTLPISLLTMVALSLAAGLAAGSLLKAGHSRILFACLVTLVAVLLDVALGSFLLRRSLMGYNPINAARFYGLGNEYLGLVLGAAILAGAILIEKSQSWRRLAVGLIFLATTVVISMPSLGANVGGAITAVLGLGYTFFALIGRRLRWRELGGLALALLGVLGLMTVIDFWLAPNHLSHLGQTFLRIGQEGPRVALVLIQSKLALNLRILNYTIWSWVLLGLLIFAPLAISYPPRWLRSRLPRDEKMLAGIRGLFVTAIIGFLVNDSGVVVAATIMIYFALALAHLSWQPGKRAPGDESRKPAGEASLPGAPIL